MAATESAVESARKAYFDDDFDSAVNLYSQAIDLDPSNPDLFAERSQAHIKLGNFRNAVTDAGKAIELSPSMSKAYLRKGSAYIKLGDYVNAKATLEQGASLAPDDSRFTNLLDDCKKHVEDDVIVIKTPGFLKSVGTSDAPHQSLDKEKGILPSKPKYRHEFYQKPDEIVVTIFAKGIQANDVTVDYGEQILSVFINVSGEEAYHLQPRLYGKIVPGNCRYEILNTKIEIRLAKAEQIQWKSLEYNTKETAVPQPMNVSSAGSSRPVYPSSNNRMAKWDKLEAEVKKEEEEEKLEGDAGLNKFFRDIFKSGDEDMKRAMTKSFVESNGTVLSTNWGEVGGKKVDGSPPDGMEMKKWEY